VIPRIVAILAFGLAFQYAYSDYLFVSFEYAHFRNNDMSLLQHAITQLFIVAPAFFYRDRQAPAAFGVALIYIIVYIPGQVMIPRMLNPVYFPTLTIQFSLVVSMIALAFMSGMGTKAGAGKEPVDGNMSFIILILTVPTLLAMLATNIQHMRLVGFSDVYDLRAESSQTAQIPILAYTNLWLAYCFLPFYLAKGIIYRQPLSFAVGAVGCILIYLATGAKAQVAMPFIMLGIHFVSRYRLMTLTTIATMNLGVVLLCTIIPTEGTFDWLKSLYLMRTLGTGGWTISTYYEFFSTYGFTHYSHINGMSRIVGAYPYGGYSMGQMIGLEYTGSEVANFNANFWASDGFGALGIMGIPIVTAAVGLTLTAINRLSSFYDPRFVSLWLTGFWLALLNLPFSTAMLSGGGLITLIILATIRMQGLATRARSATTALKPA
jgi:hypothetical protein